MLAFGANRTRTTSNQEPLSERSSTSLDRRERDQAIRTLCRHQVAVLSSRSPFPTAALAVRIANLNDELAGRRRGNLHVEPGPDKREYESAGFRKGQRLFRPVVLLVPVPVHHDRSPSGYWRCA